MQSNETIVIVGYGWVGQANALSLTLMGYKVCFFDVAPQISYRYEDKYKDTYSKVERLSKLTEKDGPSTYYIVSVGDRVNFETGEQDISGIKKALESLKNVQGTVILRSTILPGYLKDLSFDFYVPEFLHEKKAVEECSEPHYFIVGKKIDKAEPSFFNTWKRKAAKVFYGTPEEASYIKYLSNIWNAVRVAFVHEFGDAIALPTSNENIQKVEKIMNFFFEQKSYLRYGKSFGGHCLPKDTKAFYTWHKKQGKNMNFIEGAYISNNHHKELEKNNDILPEWFSEWSRSEISGKVALRALGRSIKRQIKKLVP